MQPEIGDFGGARRVRGLGYNGRVGGDAADSVTFEYTVGTTVEPRWMARLANRWVRMERTQ